MAANAPGTIVALYLAPANGQPLQPCQSVQLLALQGIAGDRHCSIDQRHPGQNLTLIEQEQIDHYNTTHGQQLGWDATRRNVVTQGVALNALVGKTFWLGGVQVRGVELCEPCKTLGKRLSNATMTPAAVVKAFVHRGGLRVDVLTDGRIGVGDRIVLDAVVAN